MPLRTIIRYLANNEALIQKLAESYPIRRAAQLTAFMFHKGKAIGEETMEKMQESQVAEKMKDEALQAGQRFQSFQKTFSQELKDGLKQMNEELKRQGKK